MILSRTSTAWIAATAGMIYFAWPKVTDLGRKALIGAAFIAGTQYVVWHGTFGVTARIDIWVSAATALLAHPYRLIVGVGPDVIAPCGYPLHNDYLQCLWQYGAIGLALMIGFVRSVPRSNRMLYSAFIIALVDMLGNWPMGQGPCALLIITIAGLLSKEAQ